MHIENTLYGPMHSQQGVDVFNSAVEDAVAQGGKLECGGKVGLSNIQFDSAFYS